METPQPPAVAPQSHPFSTIIFAVFLADKQLTSLFAAK